MSVGPIIIFDKSTLQSLSIDESCWLQNFFLTNITPLFYIETLGDLEKETKGKRTPQQIVGELAKKTPQTSYPNIHHHTLLVNDFLGNKVEMSNRPILGGGETKISPDGKIGVHFKQFPEVEAMQRWEKEEFLEIERNFAKQWRQALTNLSFDSTIGLIKNIIPRGKRFKDLKEVKSFVDRFVQGQFRELYHLAFEILGIPAKLQPHIISRWLEEKCPSFDEFAPYAAYVLRVDLFFFIALASGLISKDRPGNKIDLAYLYYLPFCMVFASNDKFHAKIAPLFMEKGQVFVDGQNLKTSLKELDEYYSKLPDRIKAQGIIKFAIYPPEKIDNLVTRLWDKFLPIWRKHAKERESKSKSPTKKDKKLIEHLKKLGKEARQIKTIRPITSDKADYVMFERKSSFMKGKWRILPQELEEAIKKKNENS